MYKVAIEEGVVVEIMVEDVATVVVVEKRGSSMAYRNGLVTLMSGMPSWKYTNHADQNASESDH